VSEPHPEVHGADTPERPVVDGAADAHAVSDDTVTDGERAVTLDESAEAPSVGAAAYLGIGAEPPTAETPVLPIDFVLPGDEPTASTAAVGVGTAAPAGKSPNWMVLVLIAALIGGLLGAGLVSLLDDDEPTVSTQGFGNNTSRIAQPQDIQGILQKVEPGVVSIKTQAFQRGFFGGGIPQDGAGTGMIISDNGEILTNAHVVQGATTIEVTLFNEKEPRQADLLGADRTADVAVIKLRDASNVPTVALGSSAALRVGDAVLAIGNALGLPGSPTVTSGIVSAKDRSIGAGSEQLEGLIQTDAAINPGNSGGPLVNAAGEVVAMNTAVIQSTGGQAIAQNVGFAIAIDTIKPMLDRLRKGGTAGASYPFIGVNAQSMDEDIKDQYGFEVSEGALVVEVTEGSPAENGGLIPGDIVTKFGDETITTAAELVAAVRARKPGDKVEVEYYRGQDKKTATITVGSRPGTPGN
jgi:serine protease Do